MLAALLRAPSYYDPANNPGEAKARWQYVLDGMVATNHLTQAQADAHERSRRSRRPEEGNGLTIDGPKALIVAAGDRRARRRTASPRTRSTPRGLTIQTTINRKAQRDAESAINQTFAQPDQAAAQHEERAGGGPPGRRRGARLLRRPERRQLRRQEGLLRLRRPRLRRAGLVVQAVHAGHRADQTLDKKSQGSPITIDSHRQRQLLRDASRGRRSATTRATSSTAARRSRCRRDEVLAQHHVRPDGGRRSARATSPPPRTPPASRSTINGKPSLQNADGQTTFGIGIGDYPVHPIDQAVGFATFANGGMTNQPYFVEKATASDGDVVYQHKDSVEAGARPARSPTTSR